MTVTRIERAKAPMLVALILGWLLATATSVHSKGHSIPTFSLSDLRRLSAPSPESGVGSETFGDDFRDALSTNGLLAVRLDDVDDENSDGFSHDRKIALDGLCSCVDHPEFLKMEQTHELTLMESSTARTSVATATVGLDHPLPLPKGLDSTCGDEVLDAMEGLRDVVASVSRAFVSALDQSVVRHNHGHPGHHSGGPHSADTTLMRDEFGRTYDSVADIVKSANHLEHFHVYTNEAESDNSSTADVAWDWHTDAGLFLVFVPAWDCNEGGHNNVDDSFYYRDTDGATVRAKFDGGRTAIVMLGQGAQDWLDLPPHKPQRNPLLKATTHSVRWSDRLFRDHLPKQRRAWYGMMNLVPENALVYGGKTLRDVKQSLSLSHQHKTDYQPSSDVPSGNSISLGCDVVVAAPHEEQAGGLELESAQTTDRRRRHLQMQDASMCNNVTNFYCWMTCMDIPKVDQAPLYLEAGYSLYCADKSILKSSGKLSTAHEACIDVHNMGCSGEWEKTVEGVEAASIDIKALESSDEIELPFCYSGTTMYMEGFQWIQSSTCVILLFPSWVLNSAGKYVAAVIGTILLAIGLEKFIQQRRKAMACMEDGTHRLVASAIFYGIQLSIGYILMLIIMVYSVVLFLAVILGLVIGHVLFNARDAIWPIHESPHLTSDGDDDDDDRNTDGTDDFGIEASPASKQSCCTTSAHIAGLAASNLLLEAQTGSERALREGSTYCQEFESVNNGNGYYGSMDGSNHEPPAKKKLEIKMKTIDQGVPEGSTPCCQHGS